MSQYNGATTPILFSGSTTLSAITVEMNNAWKPGETVAKGKRQPVKSCGEKKDRDGIVRKRDGGGQTDGERGRQVGADRGVEVGDSGSSRADELLDPAYPVLRRG
jgi:hypothetical protein